METPNDPVAFELKHVRDVYDQIAAHFSDTRYKAWPVVERFLTTMPANTVGLDLGCGNGKYINLNKDIHIIGSDITPGLLNICHQRGFEVVLADASQTPFVSSQFDFSISIAVIHHFSTIERRVAAISECLRVLKPGGRALIFVWAFEQEGRRKFDKQDVFVSWKMPKEKYGLIKGEEEQTKSEEKQAKTTEEDRDETYHRYYHLFVKGELDSLVEQTKMAKILETGYDRDNWYVIAERI